MVTSHILVTSSWEGQAAVHLPVPRPKFQGVHLRYPTSAVHVGRRLATPHPCGLGIVTIRGKNGDETRETWSLHCVIGDANRYLKWQIHMHTYGPQKLGPQLLSPVSPSKFVRKLSSNMPIWIHGCLLMISPWLTKFWKMNMLNWCIYFTAQQLSFVWRYIYFYRHIIPHKYLSLNLYFQHVYMPHNVYEQRITSFWHIHTIQKRLATLKSCWNQYHVPNRPIPLYFVSKPHV